MTSARIDRLAIMVVIVLLGGAVIEKLSLLPPVDAKAYQTVLSSRSNRARTL